MKRKLAVLLTATLVVLVACTGVCNAAASTSASRGATQPKLRVYAAASLSHAFPAMVTKFKSVYPQHKNLKFVWNFQGTDTLVAQIQNGARPDVFASASTKYGKVIYDGGYSYAPHSFCQNKLCVIVPAANTAGIDDLGDLTGDVKIAVGDSAVPIGTYTRTVLNNITSSGDYGDTYSTDVLANVVINCTSVSAVVALVKLDEVDAGFVYQSDPYYAGTSVTKIDIPNDYQSDPLPTYPISRLKAARQPVAAKHFIKFVMSPAGQRILKKYGFLPKPVTTTASSLTAVAAQ